MFEIHDTILYRLRFAQNSHPQQIFPVINWPFVFLLLRTAYQCLLPISQLKWLHFVHFVVVVYVFTILILCWDGDGQIMLPILLDACSLSLLTISLVGRKFLNFM